MCSIVSKDGYNFRAANHTNSPVFLWIFYVLYGSMDLKELNCIPKISVTKCEKMGHIGIVEIEQETSWDIGVCLCTT